MLSDVNEVYKIIKEEFEVLKDKYGDERRTKIEANDEEIEDEDLIESEEVVVTITHNGYIKQIPIDSYRSQGRGGRGLRGVETREQDFVTNLFVANTLTTLLVFTDKGKVYWLKVYRLPKGTRTSKGKSISNVVDLSGDEKVQAILPC